MNWTQDGLVETRNPVKGSLGELKTAGSLGFKLNANVIPLPAVPRGFFAAGVSECGCKRCLCGIENQCATIAEWDFSGSLNRVLVEAFGVCASGVPFLAEPVQVRFVIGDPFLDGLPGRLDGIAERS
jgi:hypothetical protein